MIDSNNSSLKDINNNKELHKLYCELLLLCSKYLQLTNRVSFVLEQATMELINSRLTMGSVNLSSQKFDMRMKAILKIQNSYPMELIEQNEPTKQHIHKTSPNKKSDEIELIQPRNIYKNDPIRWFGIITPKILRNSQGLFKTSIIEMVLVTNVKTKMVEILNKITKLQKTY